MRSLTRAATRLLLVASAFLAVASALADGVVGNTLPGDFPVPLDASLGEPLLGFGAAGTPTRTPVVFVHGNNDTPFPTACNPYGRVQAFAQFLADSGYALADLWAVGYQGDQCDLSLDPTQRSGPAHTTSANVPDVRAFVLAALRYTGARQVDVVAHSLGSVIVREWLRQHPEEGRFVRRFVAIDGANHGIINCSPNPLNYWQTPSLGGFTPASAVCEELGSPNTPFLKRLNKGQEAPGAGKDTLVIRNADTSFVYFPKQDGVFAPVPAEDSFGQPADFSRSASLKGARELDLTGQGIYDGILLTTHLGILNSPDTWAATLRFLSER
jgi:pimeloyl-ACP methyl ester carboxylesterase